MFYKKVRAFMLILFGYFFGPMQFKYFETIFTRVLQGFVFLR